MKVSTKLKPVGEKTLQKIVDQSEIELDIVVQYVSGKLMLVQGDETSLYYFINWLLGEKNDLVSVIYTSPGEIQTKVVDDSPYLISVWVYHTKDKVAIESRELAVTSTIQLGMDATVEEKYLFSTQISDEMAQQLSGIEGLHHRQHVKGKFTACNLLYIRSIEHLAKIEHRLQGQALCPVMA